MKSGLTGLAQVKGRNDISWEKKVEFDNEYIDKFKRIGVCFDIKILVMTIFKVFKKEDIYENKIDNNLTDEEAAKLQEEEIIRLAHIKER